ncbi:MAG: three-Cys-motif partner protein TcmP [Planctomycetota bacterium]
MSELDEIGVWSEIKLEILKKYAKAYSTILSAKRFHHIYIDAFAGAGKHISRESRKLIPGSPLNALNVEPPFDEYYFVDLKRIRVEALEQISNDRSNVKVLHGDCNKILLNEVFPHVKYEDYLRGLCLLDPYGLDLNWEVIETAGKMRSIEIFLNFPLADMNRNVLWGNPNKVDNNQLERLNRYWGDESWKKTAYDPNNNLFGYELKTRDSNAVVEAFQKRLVSVATFSCVPKPIPMRNSKGVILYYLFFASHNATGAKIAKDIFDKYRNKGV